MKFNIWDKLSFLKAQFFDYFEKEKRIELEEEYLKPSNRIFKHAYKKFGDELNAVSLLQTIQKLKASVEVLV